MKNNKKVNEFVQKLRTKKFLVTMYFKLMLYKIYKVCKFLKSQNEVDICTHYLKINGYVGHRLGCKNWDLAHVLANLSDGNFLDMGSSDSYILQNVIIKGIKGEKYGIDLQHPDQLIEGVKYIQGNLIDTKLPDNFFANVTCLSVIEHQINFDYFAKEVSRILMKGGKLYLTFDYWEPKVSPSLKIFELAWNPLGKEDVKQLLNFCKKYNLNLVQDIDWETQNPVINQTYHSPDPSISYTFGILVFKKQ